LAAELGASRVRLRLRRVTPLMLESKALAFDINHEYIDAADFTT
jgi:hypothetical protein